jgi:hypothetical protein
MEFAQTLSAVLSAETTADTLHNKIQEKIHEKHPRKISILLTRFPDNGSRAVSMLTRFYYTHASIGLDEDMNTFYSFVTKGFLVEKVTRYIRPDWDPIPCMLYEIPVSEEHYQRIKEILNSFVEKKKSLQYHKVGVAFALFNIPFKRKNRYFCSQFVADVLRQSHTIFMHKDSTLIFPKDLHRLPQNRLVFQGTLPDFAESYGLFQN